MIMNDIQKIYKKLEKDVAKNEKALGKICNKFIKDEDDMESIIDINYRAEKLFSNKQDMILINLITNAYNMELNKVLVYIANIMYDGTTNTETLDKIYNDISNIIRKGTTEEISIESEMEI